MIAVLATICLGAVCQDKLVSDSTLDGRITMTSCAMAPAALSEWMKQYPGYRFAGWKCVIGDKRKAI